MSRINVSAVSYLNTKCFVQGLRRSMIADSINISLDVPSVSASKLIGGEVDFALIPVATIPNLSKYHIYTNHCIGSLDSVSTVCVYSYVPLEELKQIELDPHSRTSNALLEILLKEYLNVNIDLVKESTEAIEAQGKLIIGDRAILAKEKYPFEFDLARAWNKATGMPFVFACWVANKELPVDFISEFDLALQNGVNNLDEVIEMNDHYNSKFFDVAYYLRNNISYLFDEEMKKSLNYFLERIR